MRTLYMALILLSVCCPALPQEYREDKNNYELSFGSSMLIYQSVMSLQNSTAIEAAFRIPIRGMFFLQAGARTSLNPALLEGFARIMAIGNIGSWQPSLGIEVGLTNRSKFTSGKKRLNETRAAMDSDISPFYIACQTAPVSFTPWDKWRLSLLEIHIGTHLDHFGRTLRLQVGLISIGRTL